MALTRYMDIWVLNDEYLESIVKQMTELRETFRYHQI